MVKIIPDLIKLQSHKNVYKYVSGFVKNDFLRQCFSFHPLLVGGNPFQTTSIYALIHYLEREWGVHYAMGGTRKIIEGMVRLFKELGGKIHFNSEIQRFETENRKIKSAVLKNGDKIKGDYFISNVETAFTYKNLIAKNERKKFTDGKIERMRYSMSLFVIYFGTKKRYLDSKLEHHNIILGPRYKGLLDNIFTDKKLAEDFSLYLHMPTKTDSSIAPEGCEGFYVLSPVPHLGGNTDWGKETVIYKDKILSFLEKNYLPDLKQNIIAEHFIDPRYFNNTLNSYLGSAFSIEPVLTQSAWFRPHNKSEDIDNLYLTGAGTHPGAGIPGVLSSAKIVDELITNAA